MAKFDIHIGDIQGDQPAPTKDDPLARLAGLAREMDVQFARLRNEQIGVNADLVICKRELAATRKALESLTPGGSEFYGVPERCVEFVRERRDEAHRISLNLRSQFDQTRAEIDRLTAENAALRERAETAEAEKTRQARTIKNLWVEWEFPRRRGHGIGRPRLAPGEGQRPAVRD